MLNFLVNFAVLSCTVYLGQALISGQTGPTAFTQDGLIALLIAALVSVVAEFFAKIFTSFIATITSILTLGLALFVWQFVFATFTGYVTLGILEWFKMGYQYIPGTWIQNLTVYTVLGWSFSSSSSISSD